VIAALAVRRLGIPDVAELIPRRIVDDRGFFAEVYNDRRLAEAGFRIAFVQGNHSRSTARHTLRGLHFQAPPFAQAKLVWVTHGSAFDVAVDIRRGSRTFGKTASVLLSAERGNQILIPAGFAHGFLTLEPDTHVDYMVSSHYAPEHDRGIRWDDPALAIDWPLAGGRPNLSPRDQRHPLFADVESPFRFEPGGSG
jgi:dTDP-4-dehydrorhamnose 3,5-epimerase